LTPDNMASKDCGTSVWFNDEVPEPVYNGNKGLNPEWICDIIPEYEFEDTTVFGSYGQWDLFTQIQYKYNTLVLISPEMFHAGLGRFGNNKKNSRMIQTFFFKELENRTEWNNDNYRYIQLIDNIDVKSIKSKVKKFSIDDWLTLEHRERKIKESAHRDTVTLPLVYNYDFRMESPTYNLEYKIFEKDIKIIKNILSKEFGGGYLIRVLFTKLLANGSIYEHSDLGTSLWLGHRIHIPIITNENVLFHVGDETVNMKEGEMWEIDNTTKHSVVNNGEDRVHLILDWITYEDYNKMGKK